ncbi:UvrD-helicase domain-containing protein [Tumebacillus sp. ITR2]|uniref:DNA 3'-5' helicase n=1 Tax=Tumebacillus amylolyticus TaxID=2801339 RepID=A0ABS1JAG9_9BACL|nr:UvrD-helicase domain-containing protein [Tumebacillus amylolyticus]MBL0387272.1 UvrD-helicase domain-containing protein [Tumebacillus amylolyticus]
MTTALITTESPRHSLLIYTVGNSHGILSEAEIVELLRKGIKVYILSSVSGHSWSTATDLYEGELLFQYEFETPLNSSESITIIDGIMTEDDKERLIELAYNFPDFNLEQYLVEHSPADKHLAVMAGAGTGKTTVMMQRILFLLHTTNVALDQIVLLTFTKDAAQHMFHKLRNVFHTRYKLTGKLIYLRGMEQAGRMQISTISSFAKKLLKEMGAVLGFGQEVQIRSFILERRALIERFLDEYWTNEVENNSIASKLSGYRMYELVEQIASFWEEMEKKGFVGEDVSALEWGEADSSSRNFNQLFRDLFSVGEEQFQKIKRDENAISLNDLTRQIDLISRENVSFENLSNKIKYLFIDEFQDTDETQIRLAVVLQQAFKSILFVVGDIKQSIYRFRGADETAFQTLEDRLHEIGELLRTLPLKKNYRTHQAVLEQLNLFFKSWGDQEHLVYSEADRLIGMNNKGQGELVIDRVYLWRTANKFIERVIAHIRSERDRQSGDITILTRTNQEAHLIKEWCDEAGINAHLVVGGGFFATEAVRDFKVLLGSLLFINDPVWQLSLRNTPYCHKPIAWTALAKFHGNSQSVLHLLNENLPYPEWTDHVEMLAFMPVLSVIRKIIDTAKPIEVYYQQQLERLRDFNSDLDICEREARLLSMQYQKNLNHLLELLHQRFSSDFLTPYSIFKWLEINIATNRDEDEPVLTKTEDGAQRLEIRTVHKSKGLEFDTVIIPFTDRRFWRPNNEILFRKNKEVEVGWKLNRSSKSPVYRNHLHNDLSDEEQTELYNEETRLLYVALTRCINRLVVIQIRRKKLSKETWSYLLTLGEGGDV